METEPRIARAIAAVRGGLPVLLPTDTVYGLVTSAHRKEFSDRLYRLKGRDASQPTALLAADIDGLLRSLPELRGRDERIVRALLPGPYTLVLANPGRRFRWLTGTRTDAIGVRVPVLPEAARRVVSAVTCVLATSANEPGEPSAARLEDVSARIRAGCAAELDAGPLAGTASTVIDFTGDEPHVIREGLAPSAEALDRVRAAVSRHVP